MQPRIDIIIDPKTGAVSYEISGVPGTQCTDLTAILTKGQRIKEEQLTAEYYKAQEEPAYVGS